jgi:hypothetical protein
MKATWFLILASAALLLPLAHADVSYQETTQITGGSLQSMVKLAGAFSSQARQANAPTITNVVLHGNRMVRSNPHTTEIIDLDQQSITVIDHDRHNYSVMTFQQMQQAMANAAAKARQQSAASSNQPPASSGAQMNFAAHISSNGALRTIDGLQANQILPRPKRWFPNRPKASWRMESRCRKHAIGVGIAPHEAGQPGRPDLRRVTVMWGVAPVSPATLHRREPAHVRGDCRWLAAQAG